MNQERPPDDASDLFGYAPRRDKTCPACGQNAEPYYGLFCCKCVLSGDAAKTLGNEFLTQADIDHFTGVDELVKAEKGKAGPPRKRKKTAEPTGYAKPVYRVCREAM